MKVLLLHPDDYPGRGPWAQQRWELIIDLAFAGPSIYEGWSRQCNSKVISLHHYAGHTESYRWIGEVLERGRGQLLDRFGLDWWELLAVFSFHEMHAFYMLRKLQGELGSASIELAATRPHMYANLLGTMIGQAVRYFEHEKAAVTVQLSRKLAAIRRFSIPQMVEIAFDKWDAGYRLRGRLSQGRRAELKAPAVLLPSAYSNVTRTLLQYARLFPERRFLLATTRRSAMAATSADNVSSVPLAAYAVPSNTAPHEVEQITARWRCFRDTVLGKSEDLKEMSQAGLWDSIPAWLRTGLRVRDAWQQLLEREPIHAVLCGDDLNVMTRLPLALGNRMGLRTIHTHHGALDGGFLFKKPFARVHLVKGEMERDYLTRTGAVDPDSIVVGAPSSTPPPVPRKSDAGDLVFFSQPCEVDGGRMVEIYRELLPRLCSVAENVGRRVIVKLHPFESRKDRQRIVDSVLPQAARQFVRVLSVPATEIMDQTWCGIGLDSTVAIECAMRGIPYFFCGWLDLSGIGYLRQFVAFRVGILLDGVADVDRIPELVESYAIDRCALSALSHPAATDVEAALFQPVSLAHGSSAGTVSKVGISVDE